MSTKKDFYEVLGVDKSASQADIKSAYRRKVKTCHPDLHPNDKECEQMFKETTEAYEILSDEQKRAAYDQYGHSAFEQGAGGFGSGFGGFGGSGFGGFGGFGGGDFSSVFEEVFNGFMGGRSAHTPAEEHLAGADMRYDLEITLKEAFEGLKKQIKLNTFGVCKDCNGLGGEGVEICSACGGRGRVRRQQGFFVMETPCSACGGSGKTIKKPCASCKGSGRVKTEKTLEVSIPAGVDTGVRMRLGGEGEAGLRGGRAGDLYVFITVKEHDLFGRHGEHLYCDIPVPMTKAALGDTIEVPTIDGHMEKVKIPAGTQSGYEVCLKGLGMPILKSSRRGNMYVRFIVETPTNLTKKQKELLEAFNEESSKSNPKSQTFFEKVQKFIDDFV